MQQEQNFLFHSCISPFLNIGLITPTEVIDKAVQYADKNSIPLFLSSATVCRILSVATAIC